MRSYFRGGCLSVVSSCGLLYLQWFCSWRMWFHSKKGVCEWEREGGGVILQGVYIFGYSYKRTNWKSLAPISQTNLSQCPALSPLSYLSLITGLVETFAKVRFHKTTWAFAQLRQNNRLILLFLVGNHTNTLFKVFLFLKIVTCNDFLFSHVHVDMRII